MQNIKAVFVFLSLLSVLVQAQPQTENEPCEVQSGKIVYRFENGVSGSEVLYFDDFGKRESLIKTVMKKDNSDETVKTLTVLNDSMLTVLDLTLGIVLYNDKTDGKGGFLSETKEMLKLGDFKPVGKEKVAGLWCRIYSNGYGKLWIWKGIVLKSEMKIMNKKIRRIAVKVDTLTAVPEKVFELPINY